MCGSNRRNSETVSTRTSASANTSRVRAPVSASEIAGAVPGTRLGVRPGALAAGSYVFTKEQTICASVVTFDFSALRRQQESTSRNYRGQNENKSKTE